MKKFIILIVLIFVSFNAITEEQIILNLKGDGMTEFLLNLDDLLDEKFNTCNLRLDAKNNDNNFVGVHVPAEKTVVINIKSKDSFFSFRCFDEKSRTITKDYKESIVYENNSLDDEHIFLYFQSYSGYQSIDISVEFR